MTQNRLWMIILTGSLSAGLTASAGDLPKLSEALPDQILVAQNSEAGESDASREPAQAKKNQRTGKARTNTRTAAPTRTSPKTQRQRPAPLRARTAAPRAASPQGDNRMAKARQLAASGQYEEAAKLLFQMSRSSAYEQESAQIKYILGLMMFELKLNQAAAFIFYDVIRQESRTNPKSRYVKQSLEKLSLAADYLDSDVLLKFAIKKIDENDFPAVHRDMLYFRTGEIRMLEKNYDDATRLFGRVKPESSFFYKAKYKQALAFAEAKDLDRALGSFEDLSSYSTKVTDKNRVNAVLGKARILYQKKNFDAAIEAYREVPRDTEMWHEALFESSWAMMQSARFRTALSNFHSLHSPYYDDHYQPESLLLRAIVYLYICRYGEMEKVLDLFERIYRPVHRDIRNTLRTLTDPVSYFREIARIDENLESIKANKTKRNFQIPFLVARQILKEGDVKRNLGYLDRLEEERKRVSGMGGSFVNSGVGKYAQKIIEKRIEATRILIGKQVRRHMILIQNELRDLFEQNGFLRFEMISGKKEILRKEIAGKDLEKPQIDEDNSRDYFVQNSFEYWPFRGEYWLDEIGNYHYVGVQACEQ